MHIETSAGIEPQSDPHPRDLQASYERHGYVLVRGAITGEAIDALMANYMALVSQISGRNFESPHSAELVAFFNDHPDVESQVYTAIRETPWLIDFARQPAIVQRVKAVLGDSCGLFTKAPFRIDMPLWTKELALWHQDYFYVRGNSDIVTAWIPFQQTTYFNGCLSVMPGSHKAGIVPHDVAVGKKWVPSSIFGNEIRLVEMNKGDLLLFNALLLHSGNLNLSSSIRYSLQPRYTSLSGDIDPNMGSVIPL